MADFEFKHLFLSAYKFGFPEEMSTCIICKKNIKLEDILLKQLFKANFPCASWYQASHLDFIEAKKDNVEMLTMAMISEHSEIYWF